MTAQKSEEFVKTLFEHTLEFFDFVNISFKEYLVIYMNFIIDVKMLEIRVTDLTKRLRKSIF